MSQPITISIPDALAERLKAVKQKFNVSGVCQDAIEREVTKQEFYMKEPKDMEQIVKRLRAEKKQVIEAMKDLGRKEGRESAENMEYKDLRQVERIAETVASGTFVTAVEEVTATDVWEEWLSEHVKETQEEQGAGFDLEAYLEGWVEGVMEFWHQIKDKL